MTKKPSSCFITTTLFVLATLIPPAQAGELIYKPQNTAFGGQNASATQLLLSKAQAQDTLKNPDLIGSQAQTAIERFQDSLERRILDQIAREIVNGVFASNSDSDSDFAGGFTTDEFSITINDDDPDVVSVSIIEFESGSETMLEIPKY